MAENNEWKAYGDVNPMEHGGVWVQENETEKGSFFIIKWNRTEGSFDGFLSDAYITPTDDFIDGEAVLSFAGLERDSEDAQKAIACFDYYGAQNFGGTEESLSIEEAQQQLKEMGIEV